MDLVDSKLATIAANADGTYVPAICAAASLAMKTLNRYYDMTDHLEVYRITMSMSSFHFSILI